MLFPLSWISEHSSCTLALMDLLLLPLLFSFIASLSHHVIKASVRFISCFLIFPFIFQLMVSGVPGPHGPPVVQTAVTTSKDPAATLPLQMGDTSAGEKTW